MTLPPFISSLLANPHRSLLGLVSLCTGLTPLFADTSPSWTKGLHAVGLVAGILAALIPSTDDPDPKEEP